MLLVHAGLLVVIGSVVADYLIERGNLLVLLQPAELLTIVGGALGIILTSSPARNLRNIIKAVFSIHKQRSYTRHSYLEALKVLYVLFQLGRGAGRLALENHVEMPTESEAFLAHPSLLADAEATAFVCDSFRMALSAGLGAEEVARLMALDIDVQRSSRLQPLRTLTNVADSLLGLGIIAAVLGVVVTTQALGGPAVDIGQRVAAALVGTFLGILAWASWLVTALSARFAGIWTASAGRVRSSYRRCA